LNKEILVVNTNPTLSRVRERWIPEIKHRLMLLHRNLHIMTRDPKDNQNKFKTRRHVGFLERMEVSKRNASIIKMI
jgi:hypothetical protein